MSRIPVVDPLTMTAEQSKIYSDIVKGPRGRLVGPLRVVLHNPELADRWQKLGAILRYDTSVPREISELAILVTARRFNCNLEWLIHSSEAEMAGLSSDIIDSIKYAKLPQFPSLLEARTYEFVRQLQETGNVQDGLYESLKSDLGVAGIMELSSIVGYYTLVAMTLNVHNIPLPEHPAGSLLPKINENDGLTLLPEATAV